VTELWQLELQDPGLEPDVSIIVCAHNQWQVTLDCLLALERAQHCNMARAEIVLVDDASTDQTVELATKVNGLRVVRLPINQGFLRAARAGAAAATGRNLLFLNNDTLPQGAWLDPLLETLDRHKDAGVVGSRLVNHDGTVQEAGGIIFDDGSGWNYGRGLAPDDPRVRFERQVDYCSGASMLVRGETWRAVGGFDDDLAPAYYEDTDFAFAARQHGWTVWYQPRSIVVHLEGLSHGTDTTSGVKRYQVINHDKFRTKWAGSLSAQSRAVEESVPSARQRTRAGRILVFENEVPTPDRDSGSCRIVELMRAMLRLGYAVTFLPLNGWRRPQYTERLEHEGIEVLGNLTDWWSHLTSMSDSVTHVWIARPHVAEEYIDRLRTAFPSATLVYDTVDLHFLRLERAAALLGDPAARDEAAKMEALELRLIHAADVAVVVSPIEADLLAERTKAPVIVIPNVHPPRLHTNSPAGRDGLLFVGGFRHEPNVDAVKWFVESVLPFVHAKRPDTVFTVVGSHVPEQIRALEGEGVHILGWVPDITPLYAAARVSVAPLRYGAGVKGKVGEALSLGVPMVLTPIAAEGLQLEDGVNCSMAEDAVTMSSQILTLLGEDDLWRARSLAGQQVMADRFSPQVIEKTLSELLTRSRYVESRRGRAS
jgi:GT2 family glycosyltransferase